jgi:uracil-DNA glycosylase family 4
MDKRKELAKLKEKMAKDESLPLRKGATNLVFGDGNPNAAIMCIGEGPGYWEDQKGIPFVGNAGAFLNQLLSSIKLPREEVFITNVVHYRPPNNRDPEPDELEAFKPYLDEMIEIINPKIILTLGRFSMAKFLSGVTISRIHGKARRVVWRGREIIVIPMYHPAAGLRNPNIKQALFNDFKNIPEILENLEKIEKEKGGEQMQLV